MLREAIGGKQARENGQMQRQKQRIIGSEIKVFYFIFGKHTNTDTHKKYLKIPGLPTSLKRQQTFSFPLTFHVRATGFYNLPIHREHSTRFFLCSITLSHPFPHSLTDSLTNDTLRMLRHRDQKILLSILLYSPLYPFRILASSLLTLLLTS